MAIREIKESNDRLLETSYGRIYQHLTDSVTFAIIGSDDKDTHESRYDELRDLIRKYSEKNKIRGFNYVKGTYTYDSGEVAFEKSFILYNISKETALEIARQVNQESIIWKDDDFFGIIYVSDGSTMVSFDKRTLNFTRPNTSADADDKFGTKLPKDKINKYGFQFEGYVVSGRYRNNQLVSYKVPIRFTESYDEDAVDTTGWSKQTPVPLKSLKQGDLFTLKDIPSPKDSQVYIKGEYDRGTRTFGCTKYSDMNSWRDFKGDKMVYIDFYF